MTGRALLLVAALGAAWPTASAQSWRTVESARQLRDSAEHRVRVRYGAGRLEIAATSSPVLYAMTLRYDQSTSTPLHSYDSAARVLTVGVDGQSDRFSRNIGDKSRGEMRLSLSRSVPVDLSLALGATKATLDLGGLDITALALASGASETVVDFSAPNQGRMRTLAVDVGAASFEARNLANANVAKIRIHGGVGGVELDFGGQWQQDMDVGVDLALGKLALHVPRDVGVRVEVEKFLATFDEQGLEKRGDAYYSENWDKAKYHLRLRAQTTFGGIELDRAND